MISTRTEKDYEFAAGGHVWRVPEAEVTVLPDGTAGLSRKELHRLHRAAANAICGSADVLTADELEFLCDVTATSYAAAARMLGVDRSTLTLWRKKGVVSTRVASLALKKWFWTHLFGDELRDEQVPLSAAADDAQFLRRVSERAVHRRITEQLRDVA